MVIGTGIIRVDMLTSSVELRLIRISIKHRSDKQSIYVHRLGLKYTISFDKHEICNFKLDK